MRWPERISDIQLDDAPFFLGGGLVMHSETVLQATRGMGLVHLLGNN